VNTFFKAPIMALQNTTLGSLGSGRLTHEFQQAWQTIKARGGIANPEALAKISVKAGTFHAQDLARMTGDAARKVEPSTLKGPLGWLEQKTIIPFANWRANAVDARVTAELQTAAGHLTQVPEQSWLGKLFRRPFTPANLDGYKSAAQSIGTLAEKSGPALGRGVLDQVHGLNRQLHATTGTAHLQGTRALESLHNARAASTAAQGWRNVARGGFVHAFKSLPRVVGRMNLFNAAMVVGSLGIVASKFLTTQRDNRLENVALQEFAADVYGVSPTQVTPDMLTGKAAHPLVAQAAKMSARNTTGRSTYSAISNVAEVAGMVTMHSAAGMLVVPYAMYGDKVLKELLVDAHNPLQAYQVLKQAETGKIAIEPEQKQQMVRALIAAVPGINSHGGIVNRMVSPMAAELTGQNLSLRELVRAIASPEKMQALAESVQAKMPAHAPKPAAVHTHAAPMLNAAAPVARVSGSGLSHQGLLHGAQRSLAKG
jgi:hypothetical protein